MSRRPLPAVNDVERFARFNGVGALGILVQLLVVHALVRWIGLPVSTATAAGVCAAVVHNFIWHRHWTWADRRDHHTPVFATFFSFALANGLVSLVGNVAIVSALSAWSGVGPIAGNLVAIAACGLINYWTGDQVVFRATERASL